ncbi:MAG TPA: hypothetical protein VK858_14085 [Longimicrobiales bacterium]|nr:hypothetical protein [Longimicrobiales bacterium]
MSTRIPVLLRVAGELTIIVVGVLIALWVDTLAEDRRDRAQEEAYLAGILSDLGTDSLGLEDRRATAQRGLDVADRLLALRRNAALDPPADSLAVWLFRAAFVDNFQPLDHTYREILGAGGLSRLSDEALRRKISGYYRSIASADFFTDWYKEEESDYWDLLANRLHPDDFEAVSRSERGGQRLDPTRVLRQLRSDDELVNAILMNRHWTDLRLGITGRRLAANHDLAEALRDGLTRLGG